MYLDQFTSTYIDGKCFVSFMPPLSQHDALLVENLQLEELVSYINRKNIRKVYIQNISDFSFLRTCKGIEHVAIELQIPFSEYSKLSSKTRILYDFSPLEQLPGIISLDIRDNERSGSFAVGNVDFNHLSHIQHYAGDVRFAKNLFTNNNLKSLRLIHYESSNLYPMSQLTNLDTLHLSFSKIYSLDGCENLSKLQCLYLHNNRKLCDISALHNVSKSLKALRIENCSSILDYSVLYSLKNLELLELSCKGSIPNLEFIRTLPKLKTFIFSIEVRDGDLSVCDQLDWVYSAHNRKHYNRKDKDLPKNFFYRGNEGIEEWRQME